MTISRKSRIKIVLSAIWFALVLFAALGVADSYSRFHFADFIGVLTVFAVLPLVILWGIGWIRAAPKERKAKQNLAMGAVGGLVAVVVGALIWAAITIGTGWQVGWMAVGVGFLVGGAVRVLGRGVDRSFGYLGAGLSLVGCLLGKFFTIYAMVGAEAGVPPVAVLGHISLAAIPGLMLAAFHPLDLLFYAIAVYEGYRFAFRKMTQAESTEVPSETPSVKKRKWYTDKGILTIGILAVIVAQVAEFVGPGTPRYTVGAYVGLPLVKILSYSLMLAVVSAVVGLRKPKAIKFKIFAWLFLSAGILDLGVAGYGMHVRQYVFDLLATRPDIFDTTNPDPIVKSEWVNTDPVVGDWEPPGLKPFHAPKNATIGWHAVDPIIKPGFRAPDTDCISVEGIGVSADNRLHAVVNGTLVYNGSVVNGYKVRRIHADKVEFEKDGRVIVQKMN